MQKNIGERVCLFGTLWRRPQFGNVGIARCCWPSAFLLSVCMHSMATFVQVFVVRFWWRSWLNQILHSLWWLYSESTVLEHIFYPNQCVNSSFEYCTTVFWSCHCNSFHTLTAKIYFLFAGNTVCRSTWLVWLVPFESWFEWVAVRMICRKAITVSFLIPSLTIPAPAVRSCH